MLKDSHGGCTVRVRGHEKVFLHLMFGILVIAAQKLIGSTLGYPQNGWRVRSTCRGA